MIDIISPVIGWIPKYVIDPLIAKFRVIRNLGDNIEELKGAAEKLDGRLKDEREKQKEAKKQEGVGASADAERWFSQADEAVSEANILRTQYEERQSRGACSNCFCVLSGYQLSKRAFNLKKSVHDLYVEDPKFGWTAASTSQQQKGKQLNTVSLEGQTGRQSLMNEIIASVLDDRYVVVGLHGMGGIGKTTILKHVSNNFTNTSKDSFDYVIFTTLSATPNFQEMRKEIAQGFGLDLKNCTDDNDVKQKLSRQTDKYLLILDDMWESKPPVDLNQICIPAPTKENGCKIITASRSSKVIKKFVIEFAGRDSLHAIPVNKLPPDEAWDLFVKKVGMTLIRSQTGIETLAEEIVTKCHGLPLAITVVGGTMSTRQSEGEWKDALREMRQLSEANLEDVEEKVFKLLMFSFEKLNPLEKSLFLYCCLYREDAIIGRRGLHKFGIGEETLCDRMPTLGDMRNKVDVLIGDLQNSSMLEDAGDGYIKVHDVLREFGLWIKSPKIIANVTGRVFPSEWSEATKISLYSIESLPQLSDDCPHLHTLLVLPHYTFMDMPQPHFLEHMPALKILYLTNCRRIRNLPPSISHLVNLRLLSLYGCESLEELPPEIGMLAQLIFLDLTNCSMLKGLPVEMKELKNLRHLDMESTSSLERIPRGLLSGLQKLEEFSNMVSRWKLSTSDLMELCKLTHLTCIDIHMRKVKVNSQLLKPLAKCFIRNLVMWNCDIDASVYSNFLQVSQGSYKRIDFHSCTGLTRVPSDHGYTNLTVVRCRDLKTLVMVEEVKVDERNNNIIAFQNLRWLRLDELHELETICSGRIPPQQPLGPESSSCLFSNLVDLTIKWCPNLKVLFTSGVTPLLLKLERLYVDECSQLEYLISLDDDDDLESIINAFPCLQRIDLRELPQLTAICNNQHTLDLMKWQSLSEAFVSHCGNLGEHPFGVQYANKLSYDPYDDPSEIEHYEIIQEREDRERYREEEREMEDDDLQRLD